jgi:pimeloyl-ACP methyl ester carboxylesterase
MTTKTILFVHGLFVTRRCWDPWVSRYEATGYKCVALAWPGRDQPVETLRKNHPDPALRRLSLDEIVNQHVSAIRALDEPPILIGHSMGGLIVQILLNRGLGVAGVAIDSAPPSGVLTTKWSFLKSNWPILNPLSPSPYWMPFKDFQYTFVNGLPLAEQRAKYEQHVVPESLRAARGTLTPIARIDFKKSHAPLLFLAGSTDHIIPASLNKTNYQKYKNSASVTNFKEFPGRTHFGIGQKGWEEMADYVLGWLNERGV